MVANAGLQKRRRTPPCSSAARSGNGERKRRSFLRLLASLAIGIVAVSLFAPSLTGWLGTVRVLVLLLVVFAQLFKRPAGRPSRRGAAMVRMGRWPELSRMGRWPELSLTACPGPGVTA